MIIDTPLTLASTARSAVVAGGTAEGATLIGRKNLTSGSLIAYIVWENGRSGSISEVARLLHAMLGANFGRQGWASVESLTAGFHGRMQYLLRSEKRRS